MRGRSKERGRPSRGGFRRRQEPPIPHLQPVEIAVVLVVVILSLGAHEAAHAWVAKKCGDSTAYLLGRMTLNPLVHIDLFFTILLPGILLLTKSPFLIGGAKPVPVNFTRLRHPYRDMALVAIAGPASNVLIGAFLYFLLKLAFATGLYDSSQRLDDILLSCVQWNLWLAVFNMIPIPPLDGSRVLTWLLPRDMRLPYESLGSFGLVLIIVVVNYVPGVREGMGWAFGALLHGVDWSVSLGGLW